MAVSQFRTNLIPFTSLKELGIEVPSLIALEEVSQPCSVEELHEIVSRLPDYWKGVEIQEDYRHLVKAILGERESWSDNALMFGDEDGDSAEVWFDSANKIKRIDLCFGLRNPDLAKMKKLVAFISQIRCAIHCLESGKIIEPKIEPLIFEMNNSKASRYLPYGPLAVPKSCQSKNP